MRKDTTSLPGQKESTGVFEVHKKSHNTRVIVGPNWANVENGTKLSVDLGSQSYTVCWYSKWLTFQIATNKVCSPQQTFWALSLKITSSRYSRYIISCAVNLGIKGQEL